mmetsp:Transcript_16219/g.33830  ORF Transcript_16219/g.33830 Transcript_16219/m.33830 type:complete len:321 (-) Transcript_16219:128-1090(-)
MAMAAMRSPRHGNGFVVKALPRNASTSNVLSPRHSNEPVDLPMKLAIEELRKRLAEECEERISGQRRLERFLQNISLPAKADAAVSDISGAGWWEMAASHLSSLEDRMVTLSEKVKELTSAHNAVVIASGGERDGALEKLQEEVQRLHEDRLTLHQTEELAAQAKEQLKAQTAEVQQVFARRESRFETLCSRVEAESSLRMGETKRRKESEQLLSSLLNDLGDLRKEFNVNTEAASRACESGLIRWGRARGPELESRDLPALPAPSPEPVATLATGTGRWVPGTLQSTGSPYQSRYLPRPTPDWSRIKTEEVLFPPPWGS